MACQQRDYFISSRRRYFESKGRFEGICVRKEMHNILAEELNEAFGSKDMKRMVLRWKHGTQMDMKRIMILKAY